MARPISAGPVMLPAQLHARYQALARARAAAGTRSPRSARPSGYWAPQQAPMTKTPAHRAPDDRQDGKSSSPAPSTAWQASSSGSFPSRSASQPTGTWQTMTPRNSPPSSQLTASWA